LRIVLDSDTRLADLTVESIHQSRILRRRVASLLAALMLNTNSRWTALACGSAQTDAAAKAGEKGAAYSGAVEVAPDVWVYQITKNGLALQLTLQGTKYYKDDDLNKK
jgi:hypothetical protein